jgi:peroxiredoxin
MTDSDTLIGKPAPSFTLPNYDGELFTFVPGEKGIPTAIFVYPAAGMVAFWGSLVFEILLN